MFLRCLGGFLVDIWNYLGSQSAFSGVFTHFLAQSRSESRAHDLDGVWTGYDFDHKNTKKRPKKVPKVSKTGRNGLTGHPWGSFVPKQPS